MLVEVVVVESSLIIPAVMPRTGAASSPPGPNNPRAARSHARGAPMAGLASLPRDVSMRYAIVIVDERGRFTDQSIVRALGWGPGDRLDIGVSCGAVVIRTSAEGVFALNARGHVPVPVAVRRWCAVRTGDRVLLAAAPEHGVLVVHTMAALDAMVERYHAAMAGGASDDQP
jgi:bifunctional DNA-binding transcriptional regulator/antitoxin component of YhaV-PrlF toxin-antitoxin module